MRNLSAPEPAANSSVVAGCLFVAGSGQHDGPAPRRRRAVVSERGVSGSRAGCGTRTPAHRW
ncbi:hypothetical protein ACFPM0_14505 [Pseudonocardia sulfidoxydans]|uniref:hypothetical protein n=1 Tax=Pseudonocardia sulfidoxydans TaxID=54011 RepID=UPI0036216C21